MEFMKISIIGAGAMGGSVARGLLKSKEINPEDISISDPVVSHLYDLQQSGVNISDSNKGLPWDSDLLVVAVKPWVVKEVIEEISPLINIEKTEVCFILAGVSASELKEMFKSKVPKNLSIAMPNTAMRVGESMTFIVSLTGKPNKAISIFDKLGKVMEITERLLPGAMALASCGIAFVMRYVRAACEGGVELGIKASEGQKILVQTLKGVAELLNQPDTHPESEIDKVTTPGGITIKGLNAMEHYGFSNAVIEGLKATVL